MFTRTLSGLTALLFLTALAAQGQIVSGSIVGTVKDPSDAAVAGASVTAANAATGLTRQANTDSSGYFSLSTLPPGRWSITTSHPGFKSEVKSNIDLAIDQTARVDVTLQLGQMTDKVTVEAAATIIETETPTIGQLIEGKPIVDLPLNGRNFIQLATLSGGVVPETSTSAEAARLGRTGNDSLTAHVAGARGSFNSFLIDGMENRGARFGELPILPSVDAIQEFKIQHDYYSAEYGNSIGIISLTIKSGTNGFHGTAYEFLRNSAFDARQFFDATHGPSPFKLNQFGFTVGGPIRRDKTFFFGNYEGRRQRRASQQFAIVPTPSQLAGNFSNVSTPVLDPFNNNAPFAGNIIPPSRISAFAKNYSRYFPAPNANLPQGNYAGAPSALDDFNQFNIRVDHRFSNNDSIFSRYSQSNWNVTQPGLLPGRGLQFPLNGQNAVVEETHVFGPASVNTAKLGFSRGFLASAIISASSDLATQLGLKNLAVVPYDYDLPALAVTGFSGFGVGGNTFRQYTNTYALSDTLALTRGRHNLNIGADIRETRTPNVTTNASNGSFAFSNRFTNVPLADFLVGAYTTASAQLSRSERDLRFMQYAAFIQDDWRLSTKLSLNLGLRYEYQQPWRDKSGAEGLFDTSTGLLHLAKPISYFGSSIAAPWIVVGGVQPGVVRAQFLNFAPRVGFAYRLNDKTTIRGGYGIFYAMPQGNDASNISNNPGASTSASYTNSAGILPRNVDTLFDPAAIAVTGASTSVSLIQPNRKTAYMEQWSLNVQRSLGAGTVVEIGYIGSKGVHLEDRVDLNEATLNAPGQNLAVQVRRPFPNFSSLLEFEGNEWSNYNGLTARLERRFANSLSILANYTYSKSLDTSSRSIDDGGTVHQNTYNMSAEYGPSAFDIRQRFTSGVVWELPFGKGKHFLSGLNGVANRIVDGWQMNTILQLQTGYPFTVTESGDIANVGNVQAAERPNLVGPGNLPGDQRTPNRWFNTAAFVLQPVNTFGNAGRDILRQGGTRSLDVSMFKNNYFGERNYNLEFRAEFFNVLNNVNFGRPGNVANGANFGVITGAGEAREIQFALKFIF